MHRYLRLLQNTASVLVLFLIISVSTLAAIGITPLSDAEVLGLQAEADIEISNVVTDLLPLQLSDNRNSQTPEYTTQLVDHLDRRLTYHTEISARESGELTQEMISVYNPNFEPVQISITVNIPSQVENNILVALADGFGQYGLNWQGDKPRVQKFTVPARSSLELDVIYIYQTSIGFPVQFSFEIE